MSITRTCRISGKEFIISDQEIALLDKLSPIIGGEKFPIPLPTLCPEERMRRRTQFKNYFYLNKRKCDLTGKDIISTFSKESKSTVWNQADWWSDTLDGLGYGRSIDWEKSLFEQIHETMEMVPQMTLDNAYKELINSEYINGNGAAKDCYLISCGADNEKCLYSYYLFSSRNTININYGTSSELCSMGSHIGKCYNVHYAFDASECRDSWFIFSCKGSQNLLGCVGLKNAKYHILNKPCSEADYKNTLMQLKTNKEFRISFEKEVYKLIQYVGVEKNILTGSLDSTGDFLYESKHCHECSNATSIDDCAYIIDCYDTHDSMDINNWGENLSLSYDSIAIGQNSSHIYWSQGCWGNANYHFYCQNCVGGSYLFGCSGLQMQSYCIFNKQYTKEAWEEAMKKIIGKMRDDGTWGEFLDPKYSWYPYDASYAMTLFPLAKEEILARGLEWSDYEIKPEGITKSIPAEKLPFDIRQIPDDVLNWAIICKNTGKLYKIQPLELDMHRKFGIPLPKTHPLERIHRLFQWNSRQFSFDF